MEDGQNPLPEITATELRRRREAGPAPKLVDVRNADEHAESSIPGAVLIPLPELPGRLAELDPDEPLVVHCKTGGRSSRAVALLMQHGFSDVRNLVGGIQAWNAPPS